MVGDERRGREHVVIGVETTHRSPSASKGGRGPPLPATRHISPRRDLHAEGHLLDIPALQGYFAASSLSPPLVPAPAATSTTPLAPVPVFPLPIPAPAPFSITSSSSSSAIPVPRPGPSPAVAVPVPVPVPSPPLLLPLPPTRARLWARPRDRENTGGLGLGGGRRTCGQGSRRPALSVTNCGEFI